MLILIDSFAIIKYYIQNKTFCSTNQVSRLKHIFLFQILYFQFKKFKEISIYNLLKYI